MTHSKGNPRLICVGLEKGDKTLQRSIDLYLPFTTLFPTKKYAVPAFRKEVL